MTPKELRARRERLGLSQFEAAVRLGFSPRGYRYLEQGTSSSGVAHPAVPRAVAVAVLAFQLAADIEVSKVNPQRLGAFCRAVKRESDLPQEKS